MFRFIDGSSKTAVQIIVLLAFLGAIFLVGSSSRSNEAEISIDFGDRVRVFQGEVIENMTILDALTAAVIAGGVPLLFSIDTARDITQVTTSQTTTELIETKKIQFYVNGSLINGAKIHQTPIRPQDKVIVKLL